MPTADVSLDPLAHPTMTVDEAAVVCRISRSTAYTQARLYLATSGAEGLPVVAFGRLLRVPTAALANLLDVDVTRLSHTAETDEPRAAS